MTRDKEYFLSKTPRQIGLENSLKELYAARGEYLKPELQKEWKAFPNKLTLYQNLDKLPSAGSFEIYAKREELHSTSEEVALACCIHGAIRIAESLELLTKGMISALEFSKKVGKDKKVVEQKLIRGYVVGAYSVGRDWMIPENAEFMDYRISVGRDERVILKLRPSKTNSKNNKEYYLSKTPRQIGFECDEDILRRDLKALVPEKLWNRWKLFGGINAIRSRLDTIQKPADYVNIINERNVLHVSPIEMAVACAIHCAICVAEAREAVFYNMLPCAEYAKKVGVKNPDIVRQKCGRGNVAGATKIGSMWFIPQNTDYYERKPRKAAKAE